MTAPKTRWIASSCQPTRFPKQISRKCLNFRHFSCHPCILEAKNFSLIILTYFHSLSASCCLLSTIEIKALFTSWASCSKNICACQKVNLFVVYSSMLPDQVSPRLSVYSRWRWKRYLWSVFPRTSEKGLWMHRWVGDVCCWTWTNRKYNKNRIEKNVWAYSSLSRTIAGISASACIYYGFNGYQPDLSYDTSRSLTAWSFSINRILFTTASYAAALNTEHRVDYVPSPRLRKNNQPANWNVYAGDYLRLTRKYSIIPLPICMCCCC